MPKTVTATMWLFTEAYNKVSDYSKDARWSTPLVLRQALDAIHEGRAALSGGRTATEAAQCAVRDCTSRPTLRLDREN